MRKAAPMCSMSNIEDFQNKSIYKKKNQKIQDDDEEDLKRW